MGQVGLNRLPLILERGVLRLEREPYLIARVQRTEAGEGSLSLRLRPEEYDWLLRILLSLGTDATILEPETLRERLQHTFRRRIDEKKDFR